MRKVKQKYIPYLRLFNKIHQGHDTSIFMTSNFTPLPEAVKLGKANGTKLHK